MTGQSRIWCQLQSSYQPTQLQWPTYPGFLQGCITWSCTAVCCCRAVCIIHSQILLSCNVNVGPSAAVNLRTSRSNSARLSAVSGAAPSTLRTTTELAWLHYLLPISMQPLLSGKHTDCCSSGDVVQDSFVGQTRLFCASWQSGCKNP